MNDMEKIGLATLIIGGGALIAFEIFGNKPKSSANPSINGSIENNIVTISGSGFTPNGSVEIYENSQEIATVTATSTGTISTNITISTSGLGNGEYNYTFQAIDGTTQSQSNTITVKMTISGISTSTPNIKGTLNDNTVTLTGSGFTPYGNVEIIQNSLNYSNIQADGNGDISTEITISTNNLGPGNYTYTYQAYDYDKNEYSNTVSVTLTITQSTISTSSSSSGSTSTPSQTTQTSQTSQPSQPSQPSGVPVITLSTNTIQMIDGATLTITGTGFVPNSKGYIAGGVSQYWAYKMFAGIQIASFTADQNGNFTVTTTYEYNQTTVSGLANALEDSNPTYIFAYDYANDVGSVNVEQLTGVA